MYVFKCQCVVGTLNNVILLSLQESCMSTCIITIHIKLLQNKTCPTGLAFSPDGKLLATLAKDRKVILVI